jgi:hypothetical protein
MEKYELSKEEVDRICSYLRAIDFFNKHQDKLEVVAALKEEADSMREKVKVLWEQLTEEQRDHILEVHKVQSEFVAKELSRKNP